MQFLLPWHSPDFTNTWFHPGSNFQQVIKDNPANDLERNLASQVNSPTGFLHRVPSYGSEVDWMEPSLPLCNASLLKPFGSDRREELGLTNDDMLVMSLSSINPGKLEDLRRPWLLLNVQQNFIRPRRQKLRQRGLWLWHREGNQLFKASKFTDALKVYTEGLQHEALNSVLLCNRAACLSKLGDYEKSVEDCTAALALRPSYAKARLRRADCFSKLERWDASVRDYEILMKENPKDKDIEKALYLAQAHAQKQPSEDMKTLKNNASSNLVMISSK
ncbi:hypothetical protein POM88_034535 [Heracleum sosnowskyi]|uniref:Tetratricopeptide repeat protein n=1 Tax=Heracleum sosnowskyi TaxID=360622 RepID=A0AAD8HLF5_9APIA|nr:hypothetical protein POM88_034535 [Heracleum sosnowskyi]